MPDDKSNPSDATTAPDPEATSDAGAAVEQPNGIYIALKYDEAGTPQVNVQRLGDVRLMEVGDTLGLAAKRWAEFMEKL